MKLLKSAAKTHNLGWFSSPLFQVQSTLPILSYLRTQCEKMEEEIQNLFTDMYSISHWIPDDVYENDSEFKSKDNYYIHFNFGLLYVKLDWIFELYDKNSFHFDALIFRVVSFASLQIEISILEAEIRIS